MNYLQKISNLLVNQDRNITFGLPVNNIADTFISLGIGESEDSSRVLGDKRRCDYITVNIDVYSFDYNEGFDTLLAVRAEIENAVKSTISIFFTGFAESGYDERLQKHVLKSKYKIIE